jgi:hypothetical protein
MPTGLVMTKIGESIVIETNDYAGLLGTSKVSFHQSHLGVCYFSKTNDYLNLTIHEWKDASVDVTGTTRIKIQSILGVSCTTLDILFNQLTKLRSTNTLGL